MALYEPYLTCVQTSVSRSSCCDLMWWGQKALKAAGCLSTAPEHSQHDCLPVPKTSCANPCRPVLPVFWSDNYITLAPCEKVAITVEARVPAERLHKGVVSCKGWNTQAAVLRLSYMYVHADQSVRDNPTSGCDLLRLN